MNKNAQISTIVLVILIVLTGAIVYIGLNLVGVFEKDKELNCNVDEPFTCKEVIITAQSQDSDNLLDNYIVLEAENVDNVEVVPNSISSSSCNNAFVEEVTDKSSDIKEIKILLSCFEGVKDEIVEGNLEIVYTSGSGIQNVYKSRLQFTTKRIKSTGN